MDKIKQIKLEQEIRNYENGDFDRDDLISLIMDMHKDHLSTSHNSGYEVAPTASPKVCPNCGREEYMYYNKNGKWYCEDCVIKGIGQTFS
jgi:hypothetical protein